MSGAHDRSDLTSDQATVETLYDDPLRAALEVRTEEGLPAARAGARLVREAVLGAAARGTRTVWATLDVSTPVSAVALEEFRDLAVHGVGDLCVRRAGGSILVDFQLTMPPDGVAVIPTAGGVATVRRVAPVPPRCPDTAPPGRRVRRQAAQPGLETARTAKAHLRADLTGRAGISGVGLARRRTGYVLRVNVVDSSVAVPPDVDGVPVEVRVTGALTPSGA